MTTQSDIALISLAVMGENLALNIANHNFPISAFNRMTSKVDELIEQLVPLCEAGDILMDGGNSLFTDTIRRAQYVESKGLLYVGSGVSGGEEGALKSPSLMPGGSPAAWVRIKPFLPSHLR
jgi:6-phosphogluconate dehydrogenase